MTQEEIKKAVIKLYKQRSKIQERINKLQDTCTHPTAIKKYGKNIGNYDPSCDWYCWIDYDCPDCGKRWTVEQ